MEDSRSHRLFAGCPIDSAVGTPLGEWAERSLSEEGVRVTPVMNMHVTLLFYAAVDTAIRDELAALTREIMWTPITVETGRLSMMGRSAITVELRASSEDLSRIAVKIGNMAARQHLFEQVRPAERLSRGRPRALHLTVARTKKPIELEQVLAPPEAKFVLDRLCLYESFLEPTGSRYEILARTA